MLTWHFLCASAKQKSANLKSNLISANLISAQNSNVQKKPYDNLTSEYNKQLYAEHIYTNLKSADLQYMNPKSANLKSVNLKYINPKSANWKHVSLKSANLISVKQTA